MNEQTSSGVFPTIDGIPAFSPDQYWGKTPRAELEKALAVLEEEGWEVFIARYGSVFDVTFEENRADWRFLIPLSSKDRVLDLGAGMGRISIPLARVAGEVVAVDQSLLRMKFLKKRAKREGLATIKVYVGSIFDLPFPAESFDLIVLNGVLEWVGLTDRFSNPREAQLAALRICRRLLKPEGHLYIGIENRLALSYLTARDHSGLRFTSYLPRSLADWYMKMRTGQGYQTYTYSKKGYEKLLMEAGFSGGDFYLPYPGYNLPRLMIPYANLSALAYAIRTWMPASSWRKKLLRALVSWPGLLVLYRHFFFSFGIIIRK